MQKRSFLIGIFVGVLIGVGGLCYVRFVLLPGSALSAGPYATP